MKTAQMDVAGYSNIIIYRMNINDDSTKALMVDLQAKEEQCFVVITTGSTQLYDYPGFGIRGFVRKTLRSLPNVRPPIYEKIKYELADDKVTRLEAYQNSLEPADQGTVYMQDLESALYYMIKKEASAKTEYTEDEDETIRSLIKILGLFIIFGLGFTQFSGELFPGRPMVNKFFKKIKTLLDKLNNELTYDTYQALLKRSDSAVGALLPNREKYIACAGSKPIYRGFPCSKWQLWHLLTVQAFKTGPDTSKTSNLIR